MRIPLSLPAAAAHPFDVVGFGLNSLDLFAVLADFPVNGSKHRLERHATLPGGPTATTLVGCRRLGWRARYLGAFGDDEEGRLVREGLAREHVDTAEAWTVPGARNQFAVILVDQRSGERTVLWHRDPALDGRPDTLREESITCGRILLVDGHDAESAAWAAAAARRAGIPTTIDIEHVRPGTPVLLKEVDVLIAAEGFPTELTGKGGTGAALQALAAALRPAVACVTLGAAGSLAICQGREIRTPAFSLPCVDTTGAGDAFRAGFLAGWLRAPDADVEEILRAANAVAALNCRALGAWAGLPAPADVDRLLHGSRV